MTSCDTKRTTGRQSRVVFAVLLIIMTAGFFLRIHRVETESIWYDEVVSVENLNAPGLLPYLAAVRKDDPPMSPLYFVMQYAWACLFGADPLRVRYLSVLLGTIAIPVVHVIGQRMFGTFAGLLAAGLTALSLPQIMYSQEVRVYALVNLLVACSMCGLVIGHPANQRKGWMLNVGSNILIAATHALSQAVYVAQGLFLLVVHRRNQRLLLVWIAITGTLVALEAAWILGNVRATLDAAAYIRKPDIADFVNAFVVLAGGRPTNWNPAPYSRTGVSLDLPLAALMALLSGWLVWRAVFSNNRLHQPDYTRQWAVLLVLWLFMPALVLYAVSHVLQPSFIFRYFVYCSMAFALLAAGGVSLLPGARTRVVAVCMLIGLATYQNAVIARPFRPDYLGAVALIDQSGGPDAPVVVLKHVNARPFRYVSGYDPQRIHEAEGIDEVHQRVLELSKDHEEAWIITWYWERLDELESWVRNQGFVYETTQLGGIPPVYIHRVQFLE